MFKPNQESFWAAPRICMCEQCICDYGSCELFQEYTITYSKVGNVTTRSTQKEPTTAADEDTSMTDFICVDTFVAVRPDEGRNEKFWVIRVAETDCVADENTVDDHGVRIPCGQPYIKGYSLESTPPYTNKSHHFFKLSKKSTFFYKESVVYPFVQVEPHKNVILLSNEEYVTVDAFITANGLSHI